MPGGADDAPAYSATLDGITAAAAILNKAGTPMVAEVARSTCAWPAPLPPVGVNPLTPASRPQRIPTRHPDMISEE